MNGPSPNYFFATSHAKLAAEIEPRGPKPEGFSQLGTGPHH
jgi:hypothetical protein